MATYNPNNPSGGTTGTTAGTTGTTTGGMRSPGMSDPTRREEFAGQGRSMSSGVSEPLEEKTSGVTTAIGERLERAGDFLEDKGKGQFIADRLHSAGKYLQETDARSMARSLDSAICAHPYRGILIGLGLGWVVGRFLSGRD